MAKETDKQKLKRLLSAHVRAQIALSWIGTEQDEECRRRIQSRAAHSETALNNHINKLLSE